MLRWRTLLIAHLSWVAPVVILMIFAIVGTIRKIAPIETI